MGLGSRNLPISSYKQAFDQRSRFLGSCSRSEILLYLAEYFNFQLALFLMSDPRNWADVAHTAVQEGLAALIGGGFTVLASAMGRKNQRKVELRKRRLELLECACTEVNEYFHELVNFDTILRREVRNREAGGSPKHMEQLKRYKLKLFDKFPGLLSAESKLQLLREEGCIKMYRKLFNACAAYAEIADLTHPDCNDQTLTLVFGWIVKAKIELLNEIGKSFTKDM